MKKSVLLRRIVLLLLSAVLLSGILSAGIYILVTQKMYADMRANELLPIARTVAEMMTDARQDGLYGHGVRPLLDKNNKNFGASIHIYNAQRESIMDPSNATKPGGPGKHPQEDLFDLSDEDTFTMISADITTVLTGSEVSAIRKSAMGDSYLVVGVPIKSGETLLGAVIFTKAMRELTDTMNGLNLTLVISTLAAFFIMLVPAYFATRRLVVPIRQMRDVAHAMAKGNFSVRADESQKGEIGELCRSMNHFAVESERLEQTRRDYVANVSHELRTPIASIRAMGETLRDGMAKTDEKRDMFYNNIVRESLRLSRLVDDLLELSRLQSGAEAMQKTQFDLREVFQNVSDIYGLVAAEANLIFTLAADMSQPVPAFSNPDRVEQVLVILLDNAVKHTPENGGITLAGTRLGGKMEISVSNTGEGISSQDLPYLFERFYKVDRSHSGGGTGLGLSIAKEIMKGLGETIKVESSNGLTTFTFTLSL